jgi:peptidyl-prolyl cis-trans isomerase B (cyclophilin B)
VKISQFSVLIAAAAMLVGCSSAAQTTSTPTVSASPATAASTATANGTTCAYEATGTSVKKVNLPPTTGVANTGTADYVMLLNGKSVGLTLYRDKTPCTVNSFESLAKQGFFDNVACHRLVSVPSFGVLQCGDPTGTGSGGPGYQFADELTGTETYPAGTLAMANAGANTNGSQFFMVFNDATLDPSYTVFGKVDAAGLKLLKAIGAGGDDGSFGTSGGGKPNLPALINSVKPR